MDFTANDERIFECRAFFLDACLATSHDIANLKCAGQTKDFERVSKLKIADESMLEFTRDMLASKARLEVDGIVGLLSHKFDSLKKEDTEALKVDLKIASIEEAMQSITLFFKAHEEAERYAKEAQHRASRSFDTAAYIAEKEQARRDGTLTAAQECNFSLMAKLPGNWNRITGNNAPAEDLTPYLNMDADKSVYPRESIKIPFKPAVWQRGAKKQQLGRNVHGFLPAESPELAGGSAEHPERTDSPAPGYGAAPRAPFSQLAYGAARLCEDPAGTYWPRLSMTECVMANPAYQHLSSEKFRALEHFAVLRTYHDHEVIVQLQQRFFSIYYVRNGAVKVLRRSAAHPEGPDEVVQILQGGDFFGFECLSPDLAVSAARYTYQAIGTQTQCYAVPVEYFSDLLLKEHSVKSVPMKVGIGFEALLGVPDAALVTLGRFALAQQESQHIVSEIVRGGSALSATAKVAQAHTTAASLLRLDRLINPELEVAEVLDEFLNTSKDILNVDRACLYVIDRRTETMRFFALPQLSRQVSINNTSPGATSPSSSNAAISVGEGVVSAINGVVEHVVQHAVTLNLTNFGTSDLFDPTVEKRTSMGRKIKHLLLTPVFDLSGRVIAVLQYTNPKLREGFGAQDVMVSECIASKAALLRWSALHDTVTPSHALTESFTFTLDRLVMDKSNRHLRGSVRFYVGHQQYGPVVHTAAVATYPIMGDLRRCDFKQDIVMTGMCLGNLPHTTRIIFAFESTNKHPIVWCGVYLFDYLRQLRQGDVQLQMWDGAVPENVADFPSLLEGFPYSHGAVDLTVKNPTPSKFLQSSGAVLTINLPQVAGPPVVHTAPGVVKFALTMGLHNAAAINPLPSDFRAAPVPLPAGARAVDWYARQMTPSESNIFQALGKIVDVIPAADLDAETRRLLWRMRNALCLECPWAMLWLVLSSDWTDPSRVEETHRLLYSWANLTPLQVFPLLDERFRDGKVRSFAASFLDQWPDHDFIDAVGVLVYLLRFEQHGDSALARLLLKRGLRTPETIGKQLLWHLQTAYLADPVVGAHYYRLLQLYLRSLPADLRARQGHGLYAMTRLDAIYRGMVASDVLVSKNGRFVMAEQVVGLLLNELNQNPWPSEFATPVPVSREEHTTGVVECKMLPHPPHTFALTLKYPDMSVSRFAYSLVIPVKVEMLYHHLLRAVDQVWSQENVQLTASSYDAFSVGGTGVVENIVMNAKALVSLAARQAATQGGAAPFVEQGSPTGAAARAPIRSASLPASLVADYLRDTAVAEDLVGAGDGAAVGGPSRGAMKKAVERVAVLVRNLAGLVVLNQALCLKEVNPYNTIVTATGQVFVQNPTSVLGVDVTSASASAAAIAANEPRKKGGKLEGVFFPRFFDHLLSGSDGVRESEFVTLMSVAFLALRKHVAFLIWSLSMAGAQWGISAAQVAVSTELLKERLLLHMNDEAALTRLKEIVRYSASIEPSFAAPESITSQTSPSKGSARW